MRLWTAAAVDEVAAGQLSGKFSDARRLFSDRFYSCHCLFENCATSSAEPGVEHITDGNGFFVLFLPVGISAPVFAQSI